jgi:hypothetical protein
MTRMVKEKGSKRENGKKRKRKKGKENTSPNSSILF